MALRRRLRATPGLPGQPATVAIAQLLGTALVLWSFGSVAVPRFVGSILLLKIQGAASRPSCSPGETRRQGRHPATLVSVRV